MRTHRRRFAAGVLAGAVSGMLPALARSADRPSRPGARTLRVGPGRDLPRPSAAAAICRDGDVIEIDAGDYRGDVAVWERDDLSVVAVGGPVRLAVAGEHAEGKAIWVVRAERMRVESVEFSGARVPHRNGAGIRLERGQLSVRDCAFFDNENGILTANDRAIELRVRGCEFGRNGHGDGFSHNLYAGTIRRLEVSESYFHHARVGHLLKSRAERNEIRYNRLTDEEGGSASYELEFPSGGIAVVVGNLIAQGPRTENPVLVSFGAEGFTWSRNAIVLAHNTLVDEKPVDGVFLRVRPGADIVAANNLLLGEGRLEAAGPGLYRNNPNAIRDDFVDAARLDYRLRRPTRFTAAPAEAATAYGTDIALRRQYLHPRRSHVIDTPALFPGALQT